MDYEKLTKQLSLNKPSINETDTKIEREWGKEPENLIEVPSIGNAYCLIKRLRPEYKPKDPSQPRKESNLARQEVKIVVEEAGRRWRQKLKDQGFDNTDRIYLSITSLYRSQEEQEKLTEKKSNAINESSHTKGAAADIDPNGFYLEKKVEILGL